MDYLPVKFPNGTTGFACGRGLKPRCACGQRAPFLCDWKVKTRKSGTCDAKLCERCAHSPATDKHLCPAHAAEWKARLASAAKPPVIA